MELHDRPSQYNSGSLRFFTSTLAHHLFLFLVYQEKKPYMDKAAELKALAAENGEGSDVSPCSAAGQCVPACFASTYCDIQQLK